MDRSATPGRCAWLLPWNGCRLVDIMTRTSVNLLTGWALPIARTRQFVDFSSVEGDHESYDSRLRNAVAARRRHR